MQRHLFVSFLTLAILFTVIESCKNEIPLPPLPGPDWVTFQRETTRGLLSNRINTIAIDGESRLWFGTDSGAVYFYKGSWGWIKDSLSYFTYDNSGNIVVERNVVAIAQDRSGRMWFGLYGGGVRRFSRFTQHSQWQRFYYPDISFNTVTSIAAAKYFDPGDIWVGSLFGLSRYVPDLVDPDGGTWYQYTEPTLPSNQVRAIAVNPRNNVVGFGTRTGVVLYDGDRTWSGYTPPPDYNFPVSSIAFNPISNVLWIGKWKGVTSYDLDNGEVHHYTSHNTGGVLPDQIVNAVAVDYRSSRWFGTNAGLILFKDTTWTRFSRTNSPLPSDTVTSLLIDQRENVWIGTAGGIAVFNENGTKLY